MTAKQERLQKRNECVRTKFNNYCKQYPQWRTEAIVLKVAKEFYLSARTIEAILRGEGIYSEN